FNKTVGTKLAKWLVNKPVDRSVGGRQVSTGLIIMPISSGLIGLQPHPPATTRLLAPFSLWWQHSRLPCTIASKFISETHHADQNQKETPLPTRPDSAKAALRSISGAQGQHRY